MRACVRVCVRVCVRACMRVIVVVVTASLLQLSRACAFQVRRIMHQRAISIHLEPRIEEPCLKDLARLCTDNADEQGKVSALILLFYLVLSQRLQGTSGWIRPVFIWVCCTQEMEGL